MDKKILQLGLYTESGPEVEIMVQRVMNFNKFNIGNPVKLDVMPFEEGDPANGVPQPHYKFRFLFPSKDIQRKFWSS